MNIYVDLDATPKALRLLQDSTGNHQLIYPEKPSALLGKAEYDPAFAEADIAFGQPNPDAVAEAPNLKWIQVSSSGITRYDTPEFREMAASRKIRVCNSANVYNDACAEHALSFILAQSRNLPVTLQSRAVNDTEAWKKLREACTPLEGQTAVIVGYGAIGKRLTELLRPFGMHIIACRRSPRGNEGIPVITEKELNETLKGGVEHIINILPASAETRHYFDEQRFAAAQPGSIFYNIGRGTTVDQQALLNSLQSRRIKAAWLDVTDPEPLPDDHPLRHEASCYITPHIAGGHTDESVSLVRHFLDNLDRFTQGRDLINRVI